MKIETDTLICKSIEPFFSKELNGAKSNTVRTLHTIKEIEQFVQFHAEYEQNRPVKNYTIKIVKVSDDKNIFSTAYFERIISDIYQIPNTWTYIISW